MSRPRQTKSSVWDVLIIIIGLVPGAILLVLTLPDAPSTRVTSDGGATPTSTLERRSADSHIKPIFTAEEAITRTLAELPADCEPHDPVVRLIRYSTFQAWRYHGKERPEAPTPGWNPEHPVWLVAVLADNFSGLDYFRIPVTSTATEEPPAADGAWYAWDANSGDWSAFAVIEPGSGLTYASIVAMPNESVTIVRATAVPALPTWTPTP